MPPEQADRDAGPAPIDWLGACRRIVEGQREVFTASPGIRARTVYEGVGEGGDRTLEIDRRCEEVVFRELDRLGEEGNSLTAISEERGEVAIGGGSEVRVVVDPIDGSLNARRTIPSHAFSLAVASGPGMDAVSFGYVYDFGASEEFSATRKGGAYLDGRPLRLERVLPGLEVVALESAAPERIMPVIAALRGRAFRVRAIGSIAICLCYVAAGRFDAMITAGDCRSVDAAAGQLIAREAGAAVAFGELDLNGISLDLDARYRLAAALDGDRLGTVLEVQRSALGS